MEGQQISIQDQKHLRIIRENISQFLKKCGTDYDDPGLLLDIAPQTHEGAAPYFKKAKVLTLDIDPNSKADYIADLCQNNENIIPNDYFDWVVCTEVLEHTLNPFAAINEIRRILKPNGLVFISTPFNFRIHGPLPDCWRFTEYGLRVLLKQFEIISLREVATEKRWLMPIHYTIIAKNNGGLA